MKGTIKKLVTERHFGFITYEGAEKDLFFHSNELKNVQFDDLKEGDTVTFEIGESPKGPNATNITREE
ncbi:MAG: cold-shock protein [Candidatus Portnoybacteria bacterium CG10_big_fil_rev_8_21_14_0_10_38_18]|uniref:Cold-shock protein n=1 Tax=Candidatus Portnoybacteria bacterium CG10_big_fil_rev_8_21_14_0_10_38_18 TaxID=1974813 RepID=A0A2M8KBY4_9BACT|nr:MAG: cold-shock protein [Candidatus Portnoybacteria bacterium CG10_big_fil_rev_8_21_14_0_10_38_18]